MRRRLAPGVALAAIAALTGAIVPVSGAAQLTRAAAGAGAAWESYRFADEDEVGIRSLGLLSLPFSAASDLTPSLRLGISGAWARADLERADGSSETLSGLTDTEVRLSATLGVDAVTLSAVGLLPTGVVELHPAEVDLAGMLAADLLPFRITNWGSGGGIGASAAAARPLGRYAVGASLGYVMAREFDPLEGSGFRYRPGDQLHLRAAVDRSLGSGGKGSASLSWQRFGADQGDGENLFQAGNRVQLLGSYSFVLGPTGSGVAWAGWLHRAQGEFDSGVRPQPVQDLAFGGVGARVPRGGAVLLPTLEVRVQRASEGDAGYLLGLGGSVELPLAGMLAAPGAQARFGSVELGSGRSSGFFGVEAGFSLRFGG